MRLLCDIDTIPASGCLEFALQKEESADCFLVYRNASIHAYRNQCPHTGAPLNWQPDQFLDYTGESIQCDLHGAQFRIEDGVCIYGPCQGGRLQSVAVIIKDGGVWLSE